MKDRLSSKWAALKGFWSRRVGANGWEGISPQIGGQFIIGGALKSDQIHLAYKSGTILIDIFNRSEGPTSTAFTRFRARFISHDDFWFQIDRKDSWRGKRMQLGHAAFDQFTIRSNDTSRLSSFLAHAEINRITEGERSLELKKERNDTFELQLLHRGAVSDVQEMAGLVELFKVSLDQLQSIGSALDILREK